MLEDGKPQTIKYFTAESDLPLTLGILIDSSGSQQRVLEMEKEVGGQLPDRDSASQGHGVRHQLRRDSNLLQDFTNSSRRLREALNSARINAPPSSCGGLPGRAADHCPAVPIPRAQCSTTRSIWPPTISWQKKWDARP